MSSEAAAAVRRFVDRVRRRSCAEDAAAGTAALVCGTCAATTGWLLASGGAGLAALAVPAGGAAALLGARMLARAALRPPSATRAAAWIESAMPELRDALATAVEAGPLAGVSADYAAPRIVGARAGALLPAAARRARAALVAVAVLLAVSVAALLARPGTRGPAPRAAAGRGPDAGAAPGALGMSKVTGAAAGGDADTPGGAAAVDVAPAEGRQRRMTLRAVGLHRDRAPAPGPVDATEILVSSPRGFERAVELFVAGEGARRGDGDGPRREDGPSP